MGKLPSLPLALAPSRTTLVATAYPTTSPCSTTKLSSARQVRHATLVARPRRPYIFTQLIQLSDGSTYTARTTSPASLYRAAKDSRNTLLWQPNERSLRNVELDEAGKLATFRGRFGRGFDASVDPDDNASAEGGKGQDDGGFADLITGYAAQDADGMKDSDPKKSATRKK